MNAQKVFDRNAYIRDHEDKFRPLNFRTGLWVPAGMSKSNPESSEESSGIGDVSRPKSSERRSESTSTNERKAREPWRKRSPLDVQLFDPQRLDSAISSMGDGSVSTRDGDRRVASILTNLKSRTPYRRYVLNGDAPAKLATLQDSMSHFGEAIEHFQVMTHVGLKVAKTPIRIAPVLLAGPPGVGKSYFASRLADAMGLPLFRSQMDMSSTSGTLAGMDRSWVSSSQGLVFNALTSGEVINPMIFLDELDKAGGRHHYDPLAPLHCLLEPETAQHFADAFVGLPIDASHIVWVATVNDVEKIDATLISRFRVFEVTQPNRNTMRKLVQEIFHQVTCRFHAQSLVDELSEDVGNHLSILSPREVRIRLEVGVGKALLESRAALKLADIQYTKKSEAKRFGFLG